MHGLVLLVYTDLVVVSLEMVFVIRDATLHSVSLMEEMLNIKQSFHLHVSDFHSYYNVCLLRMHIRCFLYNIDENCIVRISRAWSSL